MLTRAQRAHERELSRRLVASPRDAAAHQGALHVMQDGLDPGLAPACAAALEVRHRPAGVRVIACARSHHL